MTDPSKTTAIATVSLAQEMGVSEIVAKKRMMDQIFRELMKEGVHYGTIPGTPKPSLWQPGAELLCRTFALAPDFENLDVDGDGRRFRSTCRVRHAPTGVILAEATRIASWYEPTFRWRKATKEEFEAAAPDRRRQLDKTVPRGKYTLYQVESEPSELENSILARAEKRCHVAATRTATAASDIFHELDPGPLHGDDEEERSIKRPQAKHVGSGKSKGAQPAKEKPEKEPPPDDGAPPPEEPPDQVDDQGGDHEAGAEAAGGGSIPPAAWANVRKEWHNRGVLTENQVKRLFAIAHKNGWSFDQVRTELQFGLDIKPEEVPYGRPYDLIVEIFEGFAPEG
jgi:hypothetical protein